MTTTADRFPSRRATTSSRHPGRVFEGTVYVRKPKLTPCPKCGVLRYGEGVHSPLVQAGGVVKDCVGDVVEGWPHG